MHVRRSHRVIFGQSATFVFFLAIFAVVPVRTQEQADSLLIRAAGAGNSNGVRQALTEGTTERGRAEALMHAVRQGASSFGFQVDPGFPRAELEKIRAAELKKYLDVATLLLEARADSNLLRLINYGCRDILGLRGVQECDAGTIVPWDEGELSALALAVKEQSTQFVELLKARGARE